MSKPVPSDDAVQYEAEVTVKFFFTIEADDDIQAEDIATYEWEDNLYRAEIQDVRVEMIEEDDEIPEYGDLSDAGMDGA
jgi:hypothetical protein